MHRIDFVGAIIGARPDAAVSRNRGDDKAGMISCEDLAVQSAAGPLRRRDVVDQDVGAGQKPVQGCAFVDVAQVYRDAALARVEIPEQPALLGIRYVGASRPWRQAAPSAWPRRPPTHLGRPRLLKHQPMPGFAQPGCRRYDPHRPIASTCRTYSPTGNYDCHVASRARRFRSRFATHGKSRSCFNFRFSNPNRV